MSETVDLLRFTCMTIAQFERERSKEVEKYQAIVVWQKVPC